MKSAQNFEVIIRRPCPVESDVEQVLSNAIAFARDPAANLLQVLDDPIFVLIGAHDGGK